MSNQEKPACAFNVCFKKTVYSRKCVTGFFETDVKRNVLELTTLRYMDSTEFNSYHRENRMLKYNTRTKPFLSCMNRKVNNLRIMMIKNLN